MPFAFCGTPRKPNRPGGSIRTSWGESLWLITMSVAPDELSTMAPVSRSKTCHCCEADQPVDRWRRQRDKIKPLKELLVRPAVQTNRRHAMTLTLRSPAFNDGERIPDRHARNHGNVSPPLQWSGEPDGTRSFVLVVEDPDAPRGLFRHWAAFDISPDRHRLDEGAGGRGDALSQGANDFGDTGYDGPQPPQGHGPHHYHFRIAALDT